jgi:hypothetical protein
MTQVLQTFNFLLQKNNYGKRISKSQGQKKAENGC